MKSGRTLVLFDFDGTVTTKDSFLDFIEFSFGRKTVLFLMICLFPCIALYFFKLCSGKRLKERFFKKLIKGWSVKQFEMEAEKYFKTRLPDILKSSALCEIEKHKKEGAQVVLVSASIEEWLKPFAEKYEMELIATKLEIINGRYTGNIIGENCHGKEKVNRVIKKYDLNRFDEIYAYGDSSGDKEMLDIATHRFFKYFH